MSKDLLRNLLRRLGLIRTQAPDAGTDAVVLSDIPSLVQTGRVDEAEARLRACIASDATNVDALHYLGLICHQSGRHEEALRHIAAAVALAPQLAFLRSNFAEALRAAGDLAAAEREARTALSLDTGQATAEFNLAAILAARNAPAEALEHALRALGARPDWPDALLLTANLYIALDERAKAQELLTRVRRLRPEDPAALVLSLRNRAWLCDWNAEGGDSHGDHSAFVAMLERWAAHPEDSAFRDINPFVAYEYPMPQALRDAVTQAYADRIVKAAAVVPPPRPSPASGGGCERQRAGGGTSDSPASGGGSKRQSRLRIGYLSADFHNHPTMHLMRGLFALHDRRRFEIFAYSLGADDGSAYRSELLRNVDRFVDIRGEAPQAAAARMRADGIDILVDLKGYTHEARPEILALRPAPVQVAWLGYPSSTGRGLADYAIVDAIVAPAEHQPHFGEQLVWMPYSYQVNDCNQPIAAETPSRADLGLPEGSFVFACFNHVYKIEPRMFAVWTRILERVPDSVLWLYVTSLAARANLEQALAAAGIDPRRLICAGTQAKPQHLARLRQADLVLDTLWINAHTGASDALWAGVPVLTCPQEAFPSRVAASLVSAAGLPQLACDSLEAYEETAVRLALHPEELQAMRRHLETEHERLPLYDTVRFARNLERAFEQMWRRHAAGEAPQAFAVTE